MLLTLQIDNRTIAATQTQDNKGKEKNKRLQAKMFSL